VSNARKDFKYALWVNHAKNPRFKLIEVPDLNLTAELPKSLALASIAVRLVHRTYDNFTEHTKNEFMAVGGVFTVDLLALPPPPKKVKGWTLRTLTPLAFDVNRLPYPIPPAGADPTLNPGQAAAPPPMVLTYKLPPELVLVDPEPMVGWWDSEAQEWKTDGVTDIKVDEDTLTYATVKLTHLALLQSRVALMPYKQWNMRPTETGESCIISLTPAMADFEAPFEIEAGDGWCRLIGPHFPQLEHAGIYEELLSPWDLLSRLSACGLHLMPEDRDCVFVGLEKKETALERVFCADLALLAPAFVLSSSKWNKDLGKDDCMVRFSEVTDFNRTLAVDLEKAFTREKETVHVMLRKLKGCALVDAKDNLEALSKELEVHMADGRDNIGAAAVRSRNETFEKPLEPMKYNQTVLSLLKGVASEEGLDRVHMASPPFTECVKNLLILLRVFTFG